MPELCVLILLVPGPACIGLRPDLGSSHQWSGYILGQTPPRAWSACCKPPTHNFIGQDHELLSLELYR